MATTLSKLLVGARIRQGLSQEAVAHLARVKQQTVSRWERGLSRPRGETLRRLAAALDIRESEIEEAAYGATSDPSPEALPSEPARPLTAKLPFGMLTDEQFEHFVADLLERKHPDADVHLLGERGDDQKGYDVLMTHPDGRRVGIQCKRRAQFGAARVQEAVREAELQVDSSVLALSRTATIAARGELNQHRDWVLWDQLDLSRKTRTLDDGDALTLVRTYFPSHIEAFLGLPESGPWMTAEEYFRGDSLTLLNHRQELVGRAHLVDQISSWAVAQDAQQLAIVVGRGGSGKSKLLWEIANHQHAAGVHFRFLAVDQTTTPRDFQLLPRAGALVVVVDDQYNVENIARIASQLQKERPHARLLVAIRPDSETVLDTQIWRLGRRPERQARWELGDLLNDEACRLSASLIDRPIIHPLTRQLAAISADCPLIAVIAADLLRSGDLTGFAFEHTRFLRAEVLRRFSEMRSGRGGHEDIAERRSVLSALAAYQPVRLNDDHFARAVTSLTGINSWDQIIRRIGELEDAGLILRRDSAVRVVPDMLGDVILGESSYDERFSRVTEFLARAQAAATDRPLEHLLVNASRMEWQLLEGSRSRGYMVDTLWQTLTAETASADNQRKAELLQSIVKAAFYQPRHALEFVNAIIRATPRSVDGPDDESAPWAYSARQVTYAISPVLQNIAHNLDYLLPAAELLWALAQEDARPANQHPGHPLRILQALARLSYARPQGYVRALLGAAKIWLSKPYKVSPFEVLEPVLATEGNEELWSDSVLTFYAYRISPRQVRELRQQVIDMAAKEARESAPPIAVRAIKTLEMAIKQPHGAYGREPTPDELSEWRDEFIPVLELMESIGVQPEIDPVVRIAIRNAVQWHAAYGAEPTKSAANAVVAGLYEGPDDGLSRCLHSFWDRMDLRPRRDYAAAEEAVIREDQRVIESLIERSTVDDVLNLIETRIVQERASFDNDGSTRFFWNMYSLAPDLAIRACESALVAGHPGIAPYTSQALAALINAQNPAVIDICRRMLATDDLELHRSVAAGLAANRAEGSCLSPDELTLLHRLAESEDRQIRASIGRAAFMVGLSDTDTMHAYDLLARVRFGDSGEIAAEVLHGFVDRGPLSWTHAGEAYSQAVLAQLGQCPSIDHYLLMAAVSELSLIDPLGVTRMLLRRIELSRSESFLDYRPLPMHWHPSLRVRETAELGRCLVEIREWLRDHINGGSRFYAYSDAAQLFSTVVGDWNDEALASLGDVSSATSKEELVAAALILAHAPYEVLFSNTTLVARLLHRAEAFGHDESSDVFRALLPTNHEIVTVWANGPDQDEADKHDRARRVATVLPAGSIQRRFFEAFAAAIEARTLFVRDSAEELEDRRDW